MAGPWDNVQLPKPPDLRPPTVDFTPLGQLGQAYYQGQQMQREQAIRDALQDKSLYDANGQLDYTKGIQKFLSLGAIDQAQGLYAIGQMQKPPPAPLADPYSTPPPRGGGAAGGANAGGTASVPTSNGVVTVPTTPVHDPNLRDDEQITPGQAAAANAPGGPVASSVQPQPAVPSSVQPQPVAPAPQSAPIQPRSVATVVAPRPPEAPTNLPAQRSNEPSNSVADALIPPDWVAAGLHAPDFRKKLQELMTEQTNRIQAIEHQNAYAKGYKKDTTALKDQVAQWAKRVEEINTALAPTTEQRNAAAAGYPSPLAAGIAQKKAEADIATQQHGEEIKEKNLGELTQTGVEQRNRVAALNAIVELGRKVPYGVVPKVQELLGRYGIQTKGLSDIQAYEAAINYMAPQLRPEGSGRLMQSELVAFKQALGGLMTDPRGREISANNLKLLAQFNAKIGEIASRGDLSASDRYKMIYSLPIPRLQTTLLPVGAMRRSDQGVMYRYEGGDPNNSANWNRVPLRGHAAAASLLGEYGG